MPEHRFKIFAFVLVVCSLRPTGTVGQGALFRSDDPIELRIETPGDRIHLEISPRGNSRLRSNICDFPGLWLFFPDGATGTLFEGQGAVPVVTHCKDRDSYEQLALLEFLVYRTYNVLTDLSLGVRLARFEYFNSERDRRVAERWGFFLENYNVLASRKGWMRLKVPRVPPDETECCHNSVPLGNPTGPVFPVPFDFDQAGLVNAPYTTTDPSLPISRVRERLFRGMCGPSEQLNATLGLFEARQTEIMALFTEANYLSEESRRRSLQYVEEFYSSVADDRRVERELISKCRKQRP